MAAAGLTNREIVQRVGSTAPGLSGPVAVRAAALRWSAAPKLLRALDPGPVR